MSVTPSVTTISSPICVPQKSNLVTLGDRNRNRNFPYRGGKSYA